MINPHGGILINQVLERDEAQKILNNIKNYPALYLDEEQAKDVRNIATGVYSPLKGFLKKDDFTGVVSEMRLKNGTVFPIPIVLDLSEEDHSRLKDSGEILLFDHNKKAIAVLSDPEFYTYEKDFIAENVYGTLDRSHPGVQEVDNMGEYLVGGEIKMLDASTDLFTQHNMPPAETRKRFQMRGWRQIVAFQTRNVPHRGHEFLQKAALSKVDGLFVQPVIGKKKADDFRDEHIISSYEFLIDKHYPKNKALLGILPLKMRYAGPREAVFHAIIRQNFGCTHFIVGRDHAGVKNFYDPFAAQEIFNSFKPGELEIEIMKFPEIVFSKSRQEHCFGPDCPEEDRMKFSGSKLRDYIKNRELPPDYIIRPEIFHMLIKTKNLFVESMRQEKPAIIQKGFVLWFTGFSQSGKSTIANRVYEILKEQGVKIESLDGDIVRETLTKDLGFSKEDRETNIRRVGFVAKLLSRNDVGVVSAFITPYIKQRDELKIRIPNFIEVFVNVPIEVCEKRDTKGLYAKARTGEIKNFTGISDPYEAPDNPDIELDNHKSTVEENAQKVVKYLYDNQFLIKPSIEVSDLKVVKKAETKKPVLI